MVTKVFPEKLAIKISRNKDSLFRFLYVALGIAFVRLSEFFIKSAVAHKFGPKEFAGIEYFSLLTNYLGIIVTFGCTGFVIFIQNSRKAKLERSGYVSLSILMVALVTILTYFALIFLTSFRVIPILDLGPYSYLLLTLFVFLFAFADMSYGIVVAILQSYKLFKRIFINKVFFSIGLWLGFICYLYLIDNIMCIYMCGLLTVTFPTINVLKKYCRRSVFQIEKDKFLYFFKSSSKLFLSNLCSRFVIFFDVFILDKLFSSSEVGIYLAPLALFRFIQFFLLIFLQAELPVMCKLKGNLLKKRFNQYYKLTALIVILLCIVLNLFSGTVIGVFYGSQFMYSIKLFPIFSIYIVFFSLYSLSGPFFISTSNWRSNLIVNLIYVLSYLSSFLVFYLIGNFTLIGFATVSTVSIFITACVSYGVARYHIQKHALN